MVEATTRHALLEIARESIERCTGRAEHGTHPEDPALAGLTDHGAFVSLHTRDWGLRGCVGCLSSAQPLAAVVEEMAEAAALRDPRFPPVQPEEVDELIIEISVLSPSEPLDSLDDVVIGRDGLLAVGRGQRGVLLPQVASERGWDPETFAAHTCIKAQLPADAYRRGDAQLYKFSAEVFSERAPRGGPS